MPRTPAPARRGTESPRPADGNDEAGTGRPPPQSALRNLVDAVEAVLVGDGVRPPVHDVETSVQDGERVRAVVAVQVVLAVAAGELVVRVAAIEKVDARLTVDHVVAAIP